MGAGGEGDDRGWDGWWHHWLDGHEFEWTPGVGDGQGGLACCGDSWGHRVRHNWTELTELEKGDIILWPIHISSMYGLLVFSTYFHINRFIQNLFGIMTPIIF